MENLNINFPFSQDQFLFLVTKQEIIHFIPKANYQKVYYVFVNVYLSLHNKIIRSHSKWWSHRPNVGIVPKTCFSSFWLFDHICESMWDKQYKYVQIVYLKLHPAKIHVNHKCRTSLGFKFASTIKIYLTHMKYFNI